MPVVTSTHRWETRGEAADECLRILRHAGYLPGDAITDPADVAVLEAILSIHPNATAKRGKGVAQFRVKEITGTPGVAVPPGTLGFWIDQIDGKGIDFSYVEAIYPSDQRKKVTNALRAAVDDLRLAFRDSRFAGGSATSDVSGDPFPNRASAVVIYESPSFSQLAFRFAESEGGWDLVALDSGSTRALVGDQLTDPAVLARWRAFWSKHARPSLATAQEGRSRPRFIETAWTPIP